jgi:hypothetical protein
LSIASLLLLQTSRVWCQPWWLYCFNFRSEFWVSLPCCFCKRLKFDVNHDDYIVLISDQNFEHCFPVAFANIESSWEPSMLCVRALQWAGVVCRVHRSLRTRLLHRQILHESKLLCYIEIFGFWCKEKHCYIDRYCMKVSLNEFFGLNRYFLGYINRYYMSVSFLFSLKALKISFITLAYSLL